MGFKEWLYFRKPIAFHYSLSVYSYKQYMYNQNKHDVVCTGLNPQHSMLTCMYIMNMYFPKPLALALHVSFKVVSSRLQTASSII
jgi:hypothetical protein